MTLMDSMMRIAMIMEMLMEMSMSMHPVRESRNWRSNGNHLHRRLFFTSTSRPLLIE
ncbi:uncharacterized protein CELE_Y50D4A.6 [Caenorhabditis elegans]|uniref:Secreted protein n=1 Tax=Caenorhabditis elegans TaxID=6239 RepID=A0A0K3AYC1_CAEEL|nr:Secreted protein [Caenorhabditis elegans]CTQ86963.1 Secreted protein [Caenorhabditis elegans]|eukprot:NP_001300264.1 Uncharacterized protein CELE_Y50D4A.6 [Caenorhabditis elegans]